MTELLANALADPSPDREHRGEAARSARDQEWIVGHPHPCLGVIERRDEDDGESVGEDEQRDQPLLLREDHREQSEGGNRRQIDDAHFF